MRARRAGRCALSLSLMLAAAPVALAQATPHVSEQPGTPPVERSSARRPNDARTHSSNGPTGTAATTEHETEVTVRASRPFLTASENSVREHDLAFRPRTRPADLLEVAPGMIVVQHASGGKANQYFLRGFDADHGTDVALSVDGVPFNLPSHAHGQGYADPHFIIPELVERMDVRLGPYFVTEGDFATAGSIDFRLRRSVSRHSVSVEAGMYGRYRLLGIVRTDVGTVNGYLAGELFHFDGPFVVSQNYRRSNIVGRWTIALAPETTLSVTLMSYAGAWNASGQIPLREVSAMRLSRFGSIDPNEGGQSERHSIHAALQARTGENSELHVLAYLATHRSTLFSNFTFFARDPVHGDMIEQPDARTVAGFRTLYRAHHRLGTWRLETLAGTQLRHDTIDNGLHHAPARTRLETLGHWSIRQSSLGLFVQQQIDPVRWLRIVAGVRADLFSFWVEDLRRGPSLPDPEQTGQRQSAMVHPKATLVFSPWRTFDVFFNFGSGFHSNDARSVVSLRERSTPLARALGYELGTRIHPMRSMNWSLALWGLDLESEMVWVGDEGTTEARGPTRRLGATLEGRWDLTPWLRADVDLSYVHGLFTQLPADANAIPLAPPWTAAAGLSFHHPARLFGSIRLRAIGDRPATEDRSLTAQGFTLLSAQIGYRGSFYEVSLTAENLLNSEWREAQFANSSRLQNEPMPVTDLHFTPGTPFSAIANFSFFL